MPVNNLDGLQEKSKGLIAEILQLIDSKRLLLLSAPKVRKNPFKYDPRLSPSPHLVPRNEPF
jgi:hypothetical protein